MNSLKANYNLHRVDTTTTIHLGADNTNIVTAADLVAGSYDQTDIIADINTTWDSMDPALQATTNYLELTTASGYGGITIGDGTANGTRSPATLLGLDDDEYTFTLQAVDDGDGDTVTPYVKIDEADWTASATAAAAVGNIDLTGLTYPTDVQNKTFIVGDGGQHPQTITFSTSVASETDVVSEINAAMGSGFASLDGSNYLNLAGAGTGYESKIWLGEGTAHTVIFNATAASSQNVTFYGDPKAPLAGDEIWSDNALVGTIIEVSPEGNTDRFKLDLEVATTYKKANAYILAKDITSGDSTRPTPNLTFDDYSFTVQHDVLRDGEGNPSSGDAYLISTYEALRLDVSPQAADPSLLVFETTTDVTNTIAPIDSTNPLALAAFFALTNGPSISVSAIGISETSSDFPEGTSTAYTEALEFLEGREVYGLVPLTQEDAIHTLFASHVTSMSTPSSKKERIAFINPDLPSKEVDTTVASGTDGDSTATLNEFDTKLADLVNDLVDEGLNPASLTVSDGVWLDIETDAKRYNLSSVVGTVATCRVSFSYGENTDNYFTTDNLPASLVQEDFSVKIKGSDISSTSDQATTYAAIGQGYNNRRVFMVVPDEVVAPVDGVSTELPGYYLCAGIAGMVGEYPPQQPFSNTPLTGYTTVNHSYPYFTDSQLNEIAGGGGYIIFQPSGSTALVCRHQLATDVSTLTKRELSITKALDFAAKFYRLSVRSFVGRYNITGETLDFLSMIVHAASEYLVEQQVLLGADPGKPTVSTSEPDRISIDIDVTVGIPGNKVTITLVV
jgi:hypothetical protein